MACSCNREEKLEEEVWRHEEFVAVRPSGERMEVRGTVEPPQRGPS